MKIVLEYVFTTKKWCLKTEFRKIEKSKEYDTPYNSRKLNLIFDRLNLIFRKNVIDENWFKMWFYNKKNDAKKEFMMVDKYDTYILTLSTFADFFKISRKVNLIFDHLKLIFRKNVINENRFKMWFYNKKMMSQKNLWWSMSMTHPSVQCLQKGTKLKL